jgi:hypothetical protein
MIKTLLQPVKPHCTTVLVSETEGHYLDYLVGKALDMPMYMSKRGDWMTAPYGGFNSRQGIPYWKPTVDWSQAGPIIVSAGISVRPSFEDERGGWTASLWDNNNTVFESGATLLIAAMRCLVVSRLGEEVELPFVEEVK